MFKDDQTNVHDEGQSDQPAAVFFIFIYQQSELSTFYELIFWLRHSPCVLIMS
jgi:hypothetical protein